MRYSTSAFSHLQPPVDTVSERLSITENLPTMEQVRSLASWDERILSKFDRTVNNLEDLGVDRSGAMAELSYLMAERGWTDEQIYVGLDDVDQRWGKFVGRYNRHTILVDLINRARQKVGYGVTEADVKAIVARIENGPEIPKRATFNWMDFLGQDFSVQWQLEGLMIVNGFGLIVAPPGTGKSQMALNLGAHLATGQDRYLNWAIRGGPQRVLFLSLEMTPVGLHMFMETQTPGYEGFHHLLRSNFFVEPISESVYLDDIAGQEWLDAKLTELQPDLVIIDSMQMIVSKEMTDELSVKAMMSYLSAVRKKHNTSMLIVHHHRKKSTEAGKKVGLELDDVYGSRYITASVDFVLSIHKETEDVLNVRTLKNRYARSSHDFTVIRDGNLMFERQGEGALRMADASGLQVG